MKIKDKTKMKNRKKNKSLKNKKTQNGKQILIKKKIEGTRLRSKVFSLEKTLVLTWFYKWLILFCFLGGG